MVSLCEKEHGSIRTRTQVKKVALVILNNSCGFMSYAHSRTGVISNRLEKSLRGVGQLVILPCNAYTVCYFPGSTSGFWRTWTLSLAGFHAFGYTHCLCTAGLRMKKSSISELLNLCRMIWCHLHDGWLPAFMHKSLCTCTSIWHRRHAVYA